MSKRVDRSAYRAIVWRRGDTGWGTHPHWELRRKSLIAAQQWCRSKVKHPNAEGGAVIMFYDWRAPTSTCYCWGIDPSTGKAAYQGNWSARRLRNAR